MVTANRQALALKAKLFRGLADPSRLAILEVLRNGSRTVGEIVTATGLAQSNASNHLACLHDCGLVERDPQGRFVHYRLRYDERVKSLLAAADEVLLMVAKGIYECVNYGAPEAPLARAPKTRGRTRLARG